MATGRALRQSYFGRVIMPAAIRQAGSGTTFLNFMLSVDGLGRDKQEREQRDSALISCSYAIKEDPGKNPVAKILANIHNKQTGKGNLGGYVYKSVEVLVEGTPVFVKSETASAYYINLEYCTVTVTDNNVLQAYKALTGAGRGDGAEDHSNQPQAQQWIQQPQVAPYQGQPQQWTQQPQQPQGQWIQQPQGIPFQGQQPWAQQPSVMPQPNQPQGVPVEQFQQQNPNTGQQPWVGGNQPSPAELAARSLASQSTVLAGKVQQRQPQQRQIQQPQPSSSIQDILSGESEVPPQFSGQGSPF